MTDSGVHHDPAPVAFPPASKLMFNGASAAAVAMVTCATIGSGWFDEPRAFGRRVAGPHPGSPKWKRKARKAQKLARRKQRGK